MNKLGVEDATHQRISLAVVDTPEGVEISITGVIDMEEPGAVLEPFFDKIHEAALKAKVQTILFNVKELSFLNSSGIKSLAKWVLKVAATPVDSRYKIRILHNTAVTWQRTSLVTLTFVAPGFVTMG